MRLAPRTPGAVLAGVLMTVLLATPALAHARLVSSSPEDGAVLDTAPTTITLTFSESLVVEKSSIRLAGPAGDVAVLQAGARDGDRTMELTDLALGPGSYTIRWVAATDDGHIERGKLSFSVTGSTPTSAPSPTAAAVQAGSPSPTATPASTTSAASPTAPAGSAPVSPAATPVAEPAPAASEGSGADVILPIALGLVLVAGVGLFVARRSRSV